MSFDEPLRAGAPQPLVGREHDLQRVSEFFGRSDEAGALLLSGEPGVGKTVVLDAVAQAASEAGSRVLRAAGVQFEADISYSALNQAFLPLRDELDQLNSAHQDAIRAALGFGAGPPPERLFLCNAVLALLQGAAGRQPVMMIVDDLQWVDRASATVFGFLARRLSGSGIRFLAASRTGTDSFFEGSGLPLYELSALDPESAAGLLDMRFPDLAGGVRRRLLDAAQGNPLALLELPGALRSDQRRLETMPAVLPLSQRLQSLFLSRVRELPVATQHLLLLATLDGTGDLGVLQASAREMNDEVSLVDLVPAERDQLVRLDDHIHRLDFRHPLIKSAVMESSTSSRRRAAHRALAQVLRDRPEARAWHLGEATLEPDEQVAVLLEEAAHRVLNRGDAVAAIAALTRAADLSPLGEDRARRLAEAAYVGAEATGALRSASELLENARRADPGHEMSLHSAAAAVQLLLNSGGDIGTAHRLLVGAIEQEEHGYDAGDAALIDALHLLLLVCNFGARAELWAPFHAALARLRPVAPSLLTVAGQTFSDPARTEPKTLRELDEILDGVVQEIDPARIVRIGTASIYPDRLSALREPSWRLVREGREGAPARRYLGGLMHLCIDDYHTGKWDEALQLVEEGLTLCSRSGYSFFSWYFHFNQGLVAASRGDADAAHELADRMSGWASPLGVRAAVHYAHHVHALAYIATGDFDEAFDHANAVSPAGDFAPYAHHAVWVFFDLVESAVRTHRRSEAAAHVRALRDLNLAALSPRLALLADGAAAQATEDDALATQLFNRALAAPCAERWPFDMARVQLAYGERLRRARATSISKAPLMAALTTFQQLGSHAWAERARKELRAAGWHVTHADDRRGTELTPQEREVAELAASGLTNKQIAERLFISHRTVGAHLYQVFPKLGITSRMALRDALPLDDRDDLGTQWQ